MAVTGGTAGYNFPQRAAALRPGQKGIASITHKGRPFRFRTNPNSFQWNYNLQKRVDQTYGGRVVQLLGASIDEFSLKADSGGGRWEYSNKVANYLRDVMVDQRDGTPATFEYTTRGWKLNVYIVSIPFEDSVEEVLREFEIQMKVQEDVSGLMSQNSLSRELSALADGVGFRRSKYNDPRQQGTGNQMVDLVGDAFGALPIGDISGIFTTSLKQFLGPGQFLPGGLG